MCVWGGGLKGAALLCNIKRGRDLLSRDVVEERQQCYIFDALSNILRNGF